MSKTLTASDRKTLIRLASNFPKGSVERKSILAGLKGGGLAMDEDEYFAAAKTIREAILEISEILDETYDSDLINGFYKLLRRYERSSTGHPFKLAGMAVDSDDYFKMMKEVGDFFKKLDRLMDASYFDGPERDKVERIISGLSRRYRMASARGWRNLERRLSKAVGWANPQYGEYTIFLSQPDGNGEVADGEYILVDIDDIKAPGDTVEAYDYQGRKESVSKRLVQKALRGRKLASTKNADRSASNERWDDDYPLPPGFEGFGFGEGRDMPDPTGAEKYMRKLESKFGYSEGPHVSSYLNPKGVSLLKKYAYPSTNYRIEIFGGLNTAAWAVELGKVETERDAKRIGKQLFRTIVRRGIRSDAHVLWEVPLYVAYANGLVLAHKGEPRKDGWTYSSNVKAASTKNAGRFPLGRLVQTRGVAYAARENDEFKDEVMNALRKYQRGDWGISKDKRMNNEAVKSGEGRIMGVYPTVEGNIWIITEWDGSATTILFPSEY